MLKVNFYPFAPCKNWHLSNKAFVCYYIIKSVLMYIVHCTLYRRPCCCWISRKVGWWAQGDTLSWIELLPRSITSDRLPRSNPQILTHHQEETFPLSYSALQKGRWVGWAAWWLMFYTWQPCSLQNNMCQLYPQHSIDDWYLMNCACAALKYIFGIQVLRCSYFWYHIILL